MMLTETKILHDTLPFIKMARNILFLSIVANALTLLSKCPNPSQHELILFVTDQAVVIALALCYLHSNEISQPFDFDYSYIHEVEKKMPKEVITPKHVNISLMKHEKNYRRWQHKTMRRRYELITPTKSSFFEFKSNGDPKQIEFSVKVIFTKRQIDLQMKDESVCYQHRLHMAEVQN